MSLIVPSDEATTAKTTGWLYNPSQSVSGWERASSKTSSVGGHVDVSSDKAVVDFKLGDRGKNSVRNILASLARKCLSSDSTHSSSFFSCAYRSRIFAQMGFIISKTFQKYHIMKYRSQTRPRSRNRMHRFRHAQNFGAKFSPNPHFQERRDPFQHWIHRRTPARRVAQADRSPAEFVRTPIRRVARTQRPRARRTRRGAILLGQGHCRLWSLHRFISSMEGFFHDKWTIY